MQLQATGCKRRKKATSTPFIMLQIGTIHPALGSAHQPRHDTTIANPFASGRCPQKNANPVT